MNTDWNGDGVVDERDRFAEVCNWTGATIDFNDDYWMTYNGGSTDLFNGEILAGQCAVFWFDLSGRDFRPYPAGGVYKLWNRDTGLVSAFTANTGAADRCYQRYPLGSTTWVLQRCTPGEPSGYWLTHPTPTPTPIRAIPIAKTPRRPRSPPSPHNAPKPRRSSPRRHARAKLRGWPWVPS